MTTQPDALQLAHDINLRVRYGHETEDQAKRRHQKHDKLAAAELRRLHESNQELLVALETLRYAYASHGNHAYCQVGIEEDLLTFVEAAIAKAERTTP